MAALRANTSYTTSVATPVTIDGYAGQELELQLPDDPFTTCDKDDPGDPGGHAFVFSGPGLYAQGPANRWHLYILDVDGTRLIAVDPLVREDAQGRPRSRAERDQDYEHRDLSRRAEAPARGPAAHTRAAPSRFPSGSRA